MLDPGLEGDGETPRIAAPDVVQDRRGVDGEAGEVVGKSWAGGQKSALGSGAVGGAMVRRWRPACWSRGALPDSAFVLLVGLSRSA